MTTLGIELTEQDWDTLLPQVDNLLKQSTDFTSPTYSLKGLESVNDLWILVKPTQLEFVELLEPLNLKWVDVELKVVEL